MNANENLLQKCWTLVSLLNRSVIIVELLGEYRVFLVSSFKVKSRDTFLNEIDDAQDVTTIVQNLQLNFALENKGTVISKINNLPIINFKFGHDNYIHLQDMRENIY